MDSRNVIVGLLGILILVAALASGAGAWAEPGEHHQTFTLAVEDTHHHSPASSGTSDGHRATSASSDEHCSPAAHACCPGLAAALPLPAYDLVLDDGGARVAFTPTLHRMSRVDGIYKPPWLHSLV